MLQFWINLLQSIVHPRSILIDLRCQRIDLLSLIHSRLMAFGCRRWCDFDLLTNRFTDPMTDRSIQPLIHLVFHRPTHPILSPKDIRMMTSESQTVSLKSCDISVPMPLFRNVTSQGRFHNFMTMVNFIIGLLDFAPLPWPWYFTNFYLHKFPGILQSISRMWEDVQVFMTGTLNNRLPATQMSWNHLQAISRMWEDA